MKKYTDTGKKDTRSGFGVGLLKAGQANPNVVALTADLKGSLKMDAFAAEFPERFIQCGIAEANMVGAAAGLNDLAGIKKKYGNRLAICGGWDNNGFLGSTAVDTDTLREKLIEYVDTLAPGGGFVYNPGVSGRADDPRVIERKEVIRDVYYNYARDYYKTH